MLTLIMLLCRQVLIAGTLGILAGCVGTSTYLELGTGINTSIGNSARPWDDSGGIGFSGSIRYEWDNKFCRYSHYSQIFSGPPFNNNAESSLDHFGCGVWFRL